MKRTHHTAAQMLPSRGRGITEEGHWAVARVRANSPFQKDLTSSISGDLTSSISGDLTSSISGLTFSVFFLRVVTNKRDHP